MCVCLCKCIHFILIACSTRLLGPLALFVLLDQEINILEVVITDNVVCVFRLLVFAYLLPCFQSGTKTTKGIVTDRNIDVTAYSVFCYLFCETRDLMMEAEACGGKYASLFVTLYTTSIIVVNVARVINIKHTHITY